MKDQKKQKIIVKKVQKKHIKNNEALRKVVQSAISSLDKTTHKVNKAIKAI